MITEEELKSKIRSKVELLNAGGDAGYLAYVIVEMLDILDDDEFSIEIFNVL